MLGNPDGIEADTIPPSSLPRVPQSAIWSSQDMVRVRNPFFATVQATPTRRSAAASSQPSGARMEAGEYGVIPPSSPLHVRRSSAQLFPAVPSSTAPKSASLTVPSAAQETPVKKGPEISTPQNHRHPSSEKENARVEKASSTSIIRTGGGADSIYKSLGWDADDDDLDDLA